MASDQAVKLGDETKEVKANDESSYRGLADKVTEVAAKMLEAGLQARQPRFNEIRKNEDMYNGVNPPALRGRSNIPFDSIIMGGFVDTLRAGLNDKITGTFGPTREQDYLAAKKITAAFNRESGPDKGNWDAKFRDSKMMAIMAGRSFMSLYVSGDPFSSELEVNDHYDIATEPAGGGNLNKHLFKFKLNIFRSREELMTGTSSGNYDLAQVKKLIWSYRDSDVFKKHDDEFANKQKRMAAFGIDVNVNSYVGQRLYRFAEGTVNYNGKWYYILFDFMAKIWIRFQPLTEVFEHAKYYPGMGNLVSWATHHHPNLFWTKAPADDIRPIAYTMKKVVNLSIDNLEKRNWGMQAYDPKIFTDPAQFAFRQDGLVKAMLKPGQSIDSGLFQFQTPDTTNVTINLVQWLNNFIGQQTAVTADAKGGAQTDRVGILVSNLAQVNKRLSLPNDQFKQALIDLCIMFDYGLYDHLREDYAVKIIGPNGARWEEEVTRKDTEREFSISIRSSDEEEQKDLLARQKKDAGFAKILTNPLLVQGLNKSFINEELLRNMGYDDEQIARAVDVNNDGDQESMARAAQAIADCLEGKELYEMYRGATPAFIEKIMRFCQDTFPVIPPAEIGKLTPRAQKRYQEGMFKNDKLMAFAEAHIPIAQENMIRKATGVIATMAAQPQDGTAQKTPVPTEAPVI